MAATEYSKKPKVLMVMHQETSTPGRCGMILEDMGYRLISCKPAIGDELPETLEDFAGAVVFGGPMSANDPDDFVKAEIEWMKVPLRENKPLFGICLGAQMLSKHLGGHVLGRADEYAEIGYYPIRSTNEGQAMMDWPSHVYHWHREGFSLPEDATLLATGDEYPNQAYKYGQNAYGVQFHSEVTTWMMNRWTTKASERFALPGAQNREQQFSARPHHDPSIRQWLEDFLELWIGPADKQG
ncbi:MAG: glutamine amidotransferase [Pseudomonadota bacterium]